MDEADGRLALRDYYNAITSGVVVARYCLALAGIRRSIELHRGPQRAIRFNRRDFRRRYESSLAGRHEKRAADFARSFTHPLR